MTNQVKLSVVIPAFNEVKNLKKGVLDEVEAYLKEHSFNYEVIIVDDGSMDGTVEFIENQVKKWPSFRLIKNTHGGKAITVMTGILDAKGEIVVFTDMDQATPLSEIEKFFPKFEEGFDIVVGSRQGRKGAPLVRKIYALGFVLLRNVILGLPVSDTQCGFKAFNKKAVEAVFPILYERWKKMKTDKPAVNAGFDVEMLYLSKKMNLKIAEVPVDWHYVGSERVQINAAFEALHDMLRIRFDDLMGKYRKF